MEERGVTNVQTLLSTDASDGRVLIAAKVALAQCNPGLECPRYYDALETALAEEPPPFDTAAYADVYADGARSWQWMAVSTQQGLVCRACAKEMMNDEFTKR